MLSHLDYALDLAEQHKGQAAILKKVSVVTKNKEDSGKCYTYSLLFCFRDFTGNFNDIE